MESTNYDKDIFNKYLKNLKKEYKNIDSHFLEMAVLQYLLLDCNDSYKPNETNELYLNAKENYNKKVFNTVLLEGEY